MNQTPPEYTTMPTTAAPVTVTFSWYDYTLFSTMLAISVMIGIYFGCFGSKQSTASEYLMGGKKMHIFPIAMSLVARYSSNRSLRRLTLPCFQPHFWNNPPGSPRGRLQVRWGVLVVHPRAYNRGHRIEFGLPAGTLRSADHQRLRVLGEEIRPKS
jgi:hypothetical protein